ncbi:MAG: hypothetical protein AA908_08310 [Chlorobi bacterium NICIL-2]|nr:MAG: hypothetical protein AA908_08310 [Chlorobi bacterium NICIL-2]
MLARTALLLLVAISVASADDARAIVEHLRAKAQRIQSLRAEVAIEVAIPSFKVPRARGVLTIVPPDSINFRSEQLTFIPKAGWQLNPLVLLQRYQFLAFAETPLKSGDRSAVLRLFPTPDTGELLAAKITVDLRDTTITAAQITQRSGGVVTLELHYGDQRSVLLPDRITMRMTMMPIAIPKALTGDLSQQTSNKHQPTEPVSGTITIEFLRYTHIERRNFRQ